MVSVEFPCLWMFTCLCMNVIRTRSQPTLFTRTNVCNAFNYCTHYWEMYADFYIELWLIYIGWWITTSIFGWIDTRLARFTSIPPNGGCVYIHSRLVHCLMHDSCWKWTSDLWNSSLYVSLSKSPQFVFCFFFLYQLYSLQKKISFVVVFFVFYLFHLFFQFLLSIQFFHFWR